MWTRKKSTTAKLIWEQQRELGAWIFNNELRLQVVVTSQNNISQLYDEKEKEMQNFNFDGTWIITGDRLERKLIWYYANMGSKYLFVYMFGECRRNHFMPLNHVPSFEMPKICYSPHPFFFFFFLTHQVLLFRLLKYLILNLYPSDFESLNSGIIYDFIIIIFL